MAAQLVFQVLYRSSQKTLACVDLPSKKKSHWQRKSPTVLPSIPLCPVYMTTYPFHGIFYFLLGYVCGYMESDVLIAKWYFNFYGKCFSILYTS